MQDKPGLAHADDGEAYPPITTYAAVGDCRTVPLISCQGSVDRLCLPSIAAPAVFASMLDRRPVRTGWTRAC
ncbi:MAG: hypothetical protein ABI369_16305 [Acetobacteraceae bacterium]